MPSYPSPDGRTPFVHHIGMYGFLALGIAL
jgi:hypothetical protein